MISKQEAVLDTVQDGHGKADDTGPTPLGDGSMPVLVEPPLAERRSRPGESSHPDGSASWEQVGCPHRGPPGAKGGHSVGEGWRCAAPGS